MSNTRLPVALPALALVACTSGPEAPSGPGFEVRVAPLTLPGVADACYSLEVHNTAAASIGANTLVWSRASVCADQFGDNRGSISYVGTCDASPSGRINTVSLVLEGLCKANGCDVSDDNDPATLASDTYVNPCPSTEPCLLERPCVENADTPVTFDLTIMRQANQGFFDIGVNFEDVFCSAKLDCVDELLHRPGGARDLTAVLAFACTSGATETCLYTGNVTVDCGGANVWTIDPSEGPGLVSESSPLLYAAAVYKGDEAFTAFKKSYWNVALGLDETQFANFPDCEVRWTTTASEDPLPGSGTFSTPADTTYPLLTWQRDFLVGGALSCTSHGLNEVVGEDPIASVRTDYTPTQTPSVFAHSSCGSSCVGPDSDNDGVPDACDTCPFGQQFNWVTWNAPISGNTATGTVGSVGVTYTSSQPLSATPDVYAHNLFPVTYGVPNVNPTIQNVAVTSNTLTFATAVTNPTFVFASIGRPSLMVPIEFSTPVKLLWCTALYDGPNLATAQPITCNGQTVSTIYGAEGYVVLEVPGTHTSVDFDYTVAESWANFVFGFSQCGAPDSK